MIGCVLLSGLFLAADKAPLSGMMMRGARPSLQQRSRGLENASDLPDPNRVDHLLLRIMPCSQLDGPDVYPSRDRAPVSKGPRQLSPRVGIAEMPRDIQSPVPPLRPGSACAPASASAMSLWASLGEKSSNSRMSPRSPAASQTPTETACSQLKSSIQKTVAQTYDQLCEAVIKACNLLTSKEC